MVNSNNLDELCGYAGLLIALAGFSTKVVIGLDINEDILEESLMYLAKQITTER